MSKVKSKADKQIRPQYTRTVFNYAYNPSWNSDSGWVKVSTPTLTYRDTLKIWEVTPGYESIIRASYGRKQLPIHAYTYRERKWVIGYRTSCMSTLMPQSGRRWAYSKTNFIWTTTHLTLPSLQSRLNVRLLNSVKDGDFQAPVALVEAKKTANMVFTRAVHLAKMINALRTGRVEKFIDMFHRSVGVSRSKRRSLVKKYQHERGRDPSGAASNLWLEATYGWTPFISEVRSATSVVLDLIEEDGAKLGRAYAKDSVDHATKVISDASDWRNTIHTLTDRTERAVWYWKPNEGYWPGRFGLLNPLEVVWELVPFSFVADWFLPIGDFLSTLDVPFRVSHVKGSYGSRQYTRVHVSSKIRPNIVLPSTSSYTGSGATSFYLLDIKRTSMVSIPKAHLSELLIDPSLGTKRMISGIALLRQQASRLR